ncbi:RNase H domain-containing protein [Trichonephila clavipes]|nr:RNase H domain-containing protein [Trichonephila clavipes]
MKTNFTKRFEISGIKVSTGNFTSSFEDTIDAVLRKSFPCDANSHDNPQHWFLRSEAELDSLLQGGKLNFLICTDSLSSLHCLLNVNSTEKLVVEVQSILFYLDCDIHFSYVRCHSGNLGNDRVDQLTKEATCQDVNLLMSVPLSHWKHLAWERTVSSWNIEFLASPKALWTKSFFQPFINGLNVIVLSLISSYPRF